MSVSRNTREANDKAVQEFFAKGGRPVVHPLGTRTMEPYKYGRIAPFHIPRKFRERGVR